MDNSLDTTKENKRLLDEGSRFLPDIDQPNAQTIISQDSESDEDLPSFDEFVRNK
jgi:hypothetical protein